MTPLLLLRHIGIRAHAPSHVSFSFGCKRSLALLYTYCRLQISDAIFAHNQYRLEDTGGYIYRSKVLFQLVGILVARLKRRGPCDKWQFGNRPLARRQSVRFDQGNVLLSRRNSVGQASWELPDRRMIYSGINCGGRAIATQSRTTRNSSVSRATMDRFDVSDVAMDGVVDALRSK